MAAYKDYYQTLGISKTASQDEIKRAFRKLAAKHHPDKNPGDKAAEERFKEINEAYTVLSDSEKRKLYDQYGTDGPPPFAGGYRSTVSPEDAAGFSDFFQTLFGGSGFGRRGSPFDEFQQMPRSVQAELELDLMQAYQGGDTTITVEGRRIDVRIPKGAQDGTKLRLRGQAPGGADLILVLRLRSHTIFKLEGDTVRVMVEVPDYTAVLGGSVRVPTLDGEVDMNLPKGTQSGRVLRLRGQGWPRRDGSRGDALAEVRVSLPKNPNPRQLELYQKLQELATEVMSTD